jgi:hypothetical protein
MSRVSFFSIFAVLAVMACLPFGATTPGQAAALFNQFLPAEVSQAFAFGGFSDRLANPAEELTWEVSSHFRYLQVSIPGDPAQYVLLAWGGDETAGAYWRLLKSVDGGSTYTIVQDSHLWYLPLGSNWGMRVQDLHLPGDDAPQILLYDGNPEEMQSLSVFAWRSGQLVLISPADPRLSDPSPGIIPHLWTSFVSNSEVALEDVDGDGTAEVIVYPSQEKVESSLGAGDWDWRFVTPTQVYRYNGSQYVLWTTITASGNDPYPVTVPGIAVMRPGTIPLSSLSSPGNGELQILLSHPAGTSTVDDLDSTTFAFQGTPLAYKKKWANQKQPDTSSANFEWEGCPVRQTAIKGNGEWNPPPEDPFLPSPDGKTEYHFVAPYLELRLPKSAVFPYLLQAATEAFAKDPARQTYFVEVPLSGKMKNGKLAAVSALVCIRKTGPSAPAGAPKAAPESMPAPPKTP